MGITDGDNKVKKFKNDREYTYNSLIKQLNLLELHVKDGSIYECNCSGAKHLPTIEGLAEEGIGFTEDPKEKKFMQKLTNVSLSLKGLLKSKDTITEDEAEEIRGWAREMRRRIDLALWEGDLPKSSRKDEIEVHGKGNTAKGDVYGTMVDSKPDKPEREIYGTMVSEEDFKDYTYTTVKRGREHTFGDDVTFVNVSPSSARKNRLD